MVVISISNSSHDMLTPWNYSWVAAMQLWKLYKVCGAANGTAPHHPTLKNKSSHQVQCNIPTFESLLRKYKYLVHEKRKC